MCVVSEHLSQRTLKLCASFVAVRCIRGDIRFRPRLLDAAGHQSVEDRAEHVETAADEKHVHPLFARALHT